MDSLRPRTLTDYLSAARRRKLAIIVPALVVITASAIAIKRLPNLYQSSTFIIVEAPSGENYSERSSLDLTRRLTTIRQQVTSRSRLEAIIEKYGLYPQQTSKGVSTDDIIAGMRNDIAVEVNSPRPEVTEAFTITYRAPDPETAQRVTTELANQLIAENVEALRSHVSGEADVLRQRAAELSSQLHDLEQKAPWLLTLKEDMPLAPAATGARSSQASAEALRAQQMTVAGLKDRQYQLQQQLTDLERRIAEQRQIVEQQKKSGALRDNPVYGMLITKRAELQGQRDNYVNKQELTDKHPRVVALNDQIAAINRQIAELRQQEAGSANQTPELRDLRTMESERTRLKAELEVTGREIDRQNANPPRIAVAGPVAPVNPAPRDAGAARLAQDYLGLKQTYKEVIGKLQDAELKRQTIGSAKVEQFRVLDEANLPQLPSLPNRPLLFGLAVVAGLALGACFALLAEFRRFYSFQDAKDVEYYTKLPMLAAIPRTVTPGERRREQWQAKLRLIFGTAAAILATVLLTKALLIVNLFALLKK